MLFEEALLLVGIPLLLAVAGIITWRAELAVIGGIGLLVAGVMMLASPLVVQYGVLGATELTHTWDCSNRTGCFGVPEAGSCTGFDAQLDCEAVAGCAWDGNCSGTPTATCTAIYDTGGQEYCLNATGCYMWNLTAPHDCTFYESAYEYGGEELPFYNNLMLGVLTAFLGALCMFIGAVSLRD